MINNNAFEEINIKFSAAISSVTVERGLSNVKGFKQKYQKAFDTMHPMPYITFGNKKLPKTTAIYNIGTWFLCPGRLEGYCELSTCCYAKCREVMGSVISSRLNNYYFWKANSAETIAMFIVYSIKTEILKGNKVNLLRFNEVGEIEDQQELEKMVKISNIVYWKTGIKSYTYTHNRRLNFDIDRPNLTICGSGFMVDNKFTVVKPEDYKEYVNNTNCIECQQNCGDCGSICARKLGVEIVEVLK